MKTILAFDFGSHTGWALSESGRRITSGVQKFELGRGESQGMRFIRFSAWLREMLDTTKPELVVYEMAHHRGGWATDLLVGFTTRLQEECAARNINYQGIHSATLKKAVTGSGKADKTMMITRVAEHFGLDPGKLDDNEADALGLLYHVRQTIEEP